MPQLILLEDINKHPIPILDISGAQVVDGTNASAQSVAKNALAVRIVSLDSILWIAKGDNPTAYDGTEQNPSIPIPALGELWLPIVPGQIIAVKGGKAAISTVGKI